MKDSFSGAVRLCLIGLLLQNVLSLIGMPFYVSAAGSLPLLFGLLRLSGLHDGFRAAFGLSVLRILLIGAGAIPVLRAVLWESVWSLLIPLCQWIALACMTDGFWAVRFSRGLSRNRSAAAVVFLQILLDIAPRYDSIVLFSSTAALFLAALWYYRRAAGALAMCDDPPMIEQ